MKNVNFRKLIFLIVLVRFLPLLNAEDRRTIPMDMYLIIDGSASLEKSKNEAMAWLSDQVVDRILVDGDKITIWAAGDRTQLIYSDTLSGEAGKKDIKDKLQALSAGGKTADFPGALRELESKVSQQAGNQARFSYSMLITASAEGLEPALTGSAQGLLRWFRSEKYSRWQVLIVAPDIGKKVQQAAAAYMSTGGEPRPQSASAAGSLR